MSARYNLGFWNLENLFDIENSPRRSEKLQRAIGKDLQGWTHDLLVGKIRRLASVIRRMNENRGPDILGTCEIENKYVLDLLVQALAPLGRRYAVAHHDMSDHRGIDIGFIYDEDLFSVEALYSHAVMRRTATRDLLQVNFRTKTGRLLVVIGNHWPSRSGGQLESACYRAIAGETLAYFHERILEVQGPETPVLAMGDFNDEPFSPSLVDYALSTGSRMKVINAEIPRFFNCMWPFLGRGEGTLFYDNFPNVLDQFLVNKNLLQENTHLKILEDSAQIIRFSEMVNTGLYPQPIPFGGMGKDVNQNGFSDHFPVCITILEED